MAMFQMRTKSMCSSFCRKKALNILNSEVHIMIWAISSALRPPAWMPSSIPSVPIPLPSEKLLLIFPKPLRITRKSDPQNNEKWRRFWPRLKSKGKLVTSIRTSWRTDRLSIHHQRFLKNIKMPHQQYTIANPDLIGLDMGGTSTDVSRIEEKMFSTRYNFEV